MIDHHQQKEHTHACRWVDVRPEYGASASILFEYLQSQDVKIATKLATILFYAIKSETEDLGRDWTKSDRDAYLKLMPLCNNRILHEITHPKSSRVYFKYFDTGLKNAKIYGNALIFNLYLIDHPEIVAEIADFLMRVEGVEIVLGIGCYHDEGVLSMRTSHQETHAGILMQTIVEGLGTGGGHSMTAGARSGICRPNAEASALWSMNWPAVFWQLWAGNIASRNSWSPTSVRAVNSYLSNFGAFGL